MYQILCAVLLLPWTAIWASECDGEQRRNDPDAVHRDEGMGEAKLDRTVRVRLRQPLYRQDYVTYVLLPVSHESSSEQDVRDSCQLEVHQPRLTSRVVDHLK